MGETGEETGLGLVGSFGGLLCGCQTGERISIGGRTIRPLAL